MCCFCGRLSGEEQTKASVFMWQDLRGSRIRLLYVLMRFRLEVSDINQNKIGQNILGEDSAVRKNEQVDLFEYKKDEIIQELQQIDVMAITPMDAMNKLFLLREKARKL